MMMQTQKGPSRATPMKASGRLQDTWLLRAQYRLAPGEEGGALALQEPGCLKMQIRRREERAGI
jgi:hypothetical protein